MSELFKDIPGYEDYYQISNLGRVKTLGWRRTKQERILNPVLHRQGYHLIKLCKNKVHSWFYIHRLVALTFIPLVEGKDFVNHKDGNKANNSVENLEWVTKSENAKHSFKTGLQDNKGVNHPQSKLTEGDVMMIRILADTMTRKDICSLYNLEGSTVGKIINRQLWRHVA